MNDAVRRCEELVSHPPFYVDEYQCSRKAKWKATYKNGAVRYLCGTHANVVKRNQPSAVVASV